MHAYTINAEAINEFKRYHGIKDDFEVAKMLKVSPGYFSMLMSGRRKLNEQLRLRLQLLTRLPQDRLFVPHFDKCFMNHQSMAYMKHYGMYPYDRYSTTINAQEERDEVEDLEQKNGNGRADFFKKNKWYTNGNGVTH